MILISHRFFAFPPEVIKILSGTYSNINAYILLIFKCIFMKNLKGNRCCLSIPGGGRGREEGQERGRERETGREKEGQGEKERGGRKENAMFR